MKNLKCHPMKTENSQPKNLGEKKMKAKKLILGLVVLSISLSSILSFAASVSAGVPQMINYQGVLTDPSGCPVADGDYTMIFRIYDTPTDGNLLWDETHDAVTVTQGNFNVLLGSTDSIPGSIFLSDSLWLAVKVGNDIEMTPRQRIASVGYAFRSEFTDTAEYALSAPRDDDWTPDTAGLNIYRLTGNVGIGTPSPQGKLDINGPLAVAGDVGTDGQFLKSQGAGTNPVWADVIPGNASVSQAKLKTATGEVSHTSTYNQAEEMGIIVYGGFEVVTGPSLKQKIVFTTVGALGHDSSYATIITIGFRFDGAQSMNDASGGVSKLTLPGGTYGFYPQVKRVLGEPSVGYAQQRYITSSGKDHWIFFLGDKVTRQVLASYQAPDHPCYGSGGDENDIPHPFGSYDPDKHEVILIDNEILPELKSKVTSKRSLLTVINEEYEIDFDSKAVYQPREIIEIDEFGDKEGEILLRIKTPEWAKIVIGKDEIYLKRRLVETLPSYISYKKLKPKSDTIAESRILSQK